MTHPITAETLILARLLDAQTAEHTAWLRFFRDKRNDAARVAYLEASAKLAVLQGLAADLGLIEL